jgi:hypothetical protein
MKRLIIFLMLLFPARLFAQQIRGIVLDKNTRLPVPYATIACANTLISASADGRFSLSNVAPGDSIKITSIGYKPYKIGYDLSTPKALTIYLQAAYIVLHDVVVKLKHDPKLDSVRVRKEFASVFAYKRTTFKDIFGTIDPYVYKPNDYIFAGNSTASLLSINLLSVVSLLSKKSNDPNSKLQQTLLKDEETQYIDQQFSRQKIIKLTNLKGDSLLSFMDDYRPTIRQARKMSDYEMMIYIKESYAVFLKTYDPKQRALFSK